MACEISPEQLAGLGCPTTPEQAEFAIQCAYDWVDDCPEIEEKYGEDKTCKIKLLIAAMFLEAGSGADGIAAESSKDQSTTYRDRGRGFKASRFWSQLSFLDNCGIVCDKLVKIDDCGKADAFCFGALVPQCGHGSGCGCDCGKTYCRYCGWW